MTESDKRQLSFLFLGVAVTCLSAALLLSNSVFSIKHTWNCGWLGCLFAIGVCWLSPDSRVRDDAARLFGVGICVAFYVTKCGFHSQLCRQYRVQGPLEVLVFVIFFAVESLLMRGKTRNDRNYEQSHVAARYRTVELADASRCDIETSLDESVRSRSVASKELRREESKAVSLSSARDEHLSHPPRVAGPAAGFVLNLVSSRRLCWVVAGLVLFRAIESAAINITDYLCSHVSEHVLKYVPPEMSRAWSQDSENTEKAFKLESYFVPQNRSAWALNPQDVSFYVQV